MPAPIVPAPTTPTTRMSAFTSSTPPEAWLSLLEERDHPLDSVLGRHRQLVEPALVRQGRGERHLLRREHSLLAEAHRQRWTARDHLRELHRLLEPVTLRCDRVHDPHTVSLQSTDPAARQHHLHRT